MKIGIYGGTFNPPHIGHVHAAVEAVKTLGLDKLLVIPAGDPPHKSIEDGKVSPENRLEMCRIAFGGIDRVEVLDIEVKRSGASYTSDTVEELRCTYPKDEFYLTVGTDMLASLYRWHGADYIVREAKPVVLHRFDDDNEIIDDASDTLSNIYDISIIKIRSDVIKISSSEIRNLLPMRRGREFLNDELYAYIVKNRLYGVNTDFDWLRERAYRWLKQKRIPHVAGCESEAVKLARRWGENEELAREAGILHDVTKKYELDEQLILCEKYGIITDNMEKHDYKLLHSKTGASVAKDEFGVCDEVYNAIYWHTTGKADMSMLEKIIYIADYIEPNRDFEGLDELRRLAYSDIDGAMILGLRMSIDDMLERGITPHVNSSEALKWLLVSNNEKEL